MTHAENTKSISGLASKIGSSAKCRQTLHAWLTLLAVAECLFSPAGVSAQADPDIEAQVAELEALVTQLEALTQYVEVTDPTETINGLAGPHVLFEGANVHVRNDSGYTSSPNGVGNLIVGYNEESAPGTEDRTGSHNLVVGTRHSYSSFSGFVAGINNEVSGPHSSVSGGNKNRASGRQSSVSGGFNNVADGSHSSVSGGNQNTASGPLSSVSGGFSNVADGNHSSVSGGNQNTASGPLSSVSGGLFNETTGTVSSVSGGQNNTASGNYSSVSGGKDNVASGSHSTVNGGTSITASQNYSVNGVMFDQNGLEMLADDSALWTPGYAVVNPSPYLGREDDEVQISLAQSCLREVSAWGDHLKQFCVGVTDLEECVKRQDRQILREFLDTRWNKLEEYEQCLASNGETFQPMGATWVEKVNDSCMNGSGLHPVGHNAAYRSCLLSHGVEPTLYTMPAGYANDAVSYCFEGEGYRSGTQFGQIAYAFILNVVGRGVFSVAQAAEEGNWAAVTAGLLGNVFSLGGYARTAAALTIGSTAADAAALASSSENLSFVNAYRPTWFGQWPLAVTDFKSYEGCLTDRSVPGLDFQPLHRFSSANTDGKAYALKWSEYVKHYCDTAHPSQGRRGTEWIEGPYRECLTDREYTEEPIEGPYLFDDLDGLEKVISDLKRRKSRVYWNKCISETGGEFPIQQGAYQVPGLHRADWPGYNTPEASLKMVACFVRESWPFDEIGLHLRSTDPEWVKNELRDAVESHCSAQPQPLACSSFLEWLPPIKASPF